MNIEEVRSATLPGIPSSADLRGWRRLHRFALAAAAATVALIVAGATVTSTGSGDAVPDWPLSYGSLLPPLVGGVLYEHTHRLVAGTTALLILSLALWLWRREGRAWVRWLGWGAALAVLAQALLGGLRVLVLSHRLGFSVAHALLAQAVLCATFALATVTSPGWVSISGSERGSGGGVASGSSRLRAWTTLLVVLLLVQLILGTLMRHLGAGLAIPDFPLSFGRLFPPFSDLLVSIHFSHRIGGLAVAVVVLSVARQVVRRGGGDRRLGRLAGALVGLTGGQVALGAAAIWTRMAIPITVAHVAVGALLMGTSVVLWLWARRVDAAEPRPSRALALRMAEVLR